MIRDTRRPGCALHPADFDRATRCRRCLLVAEELEVRETLQLLIICHAGCAVQKPVLTRKYTVISLPQSLALRHAPDGVRLSAGRWRKIQGPARADGEE